LFFIEDFRRNAYGLHADKINGHNCWVLQKFLKRYPILVKEMKTEQFLKNNITIDEGGCASLSIVDDFALARAEATCSKCDDSMTTSTPSPLHISILVWFAPLHLLRGLGGVSGFWFLSHFTSQV
jgi:hypothetical protein